jgi:F-type H+-transporting ATPase subunit delta
MAEFKNADPTHDTVLDVKAERLSRVYAIAGLDAAGDVAQQESLVTDLEAVAAEVLGKDPRLVEVFASALISSEEKSGMLDRILGGRISVTALNMLKVMTRHKRITLIRDVARAARKEWYSRSGRIPTQLETANPLDSVLQQEILTAFHHVLGADPIVTHRVNPDLIAGFVIRVGDRVYDGSVRTQLEHMRQGMINRAVEAIQRDGHHKYITADA